MKYRKDFITNSSSSSFIGVFAKISNKNKARGVINRYNLADCVFDKNSMAKKIKDGDLTLSWGGFDLAQNVTEHSIKDNSEWDDLYLYWYSVNEIEDIDDYDDYLLSDFCDSEIEIFRAICEEHGFNVIDSQYGAGYNG